MFCQVQPSMSYYAHRILEVAASARGREFYIGNNRGVSNGLCYEHHVYGRLVEVTR